MKAVLLIVFICLSRVLAAQDTLKPVNTDTVPYIPGDSLNKVAETLSDADTIKKVLKIHSPRTAAIRSAILPGLGQIYNKKYWKLPIVYAALGISGGVFIYNLDNYRDLRFAYRARFEATPSQTNPNPDSTNFFKIRPDLVALDLNALRSYRDEFRRNIDYSALIFILLWGLNVVDATVDAHLKSFDVSPDLGFRFKFGPSQMAGTTGVSLVVAFK